MIGDILQELRMDIPLDQQELSKRLGISRSALSSYECGKTEPPTSVLYKYAEYFNVSMDYLCGLTRDRTSLKDRNTDFQTKDGNIPLSDITAKLQNLSIYRRSLIISMLDEMNQLELCERQIHASVKRKK